MDKKPERRVRNVLCQAVALDTVAFTLGGNVEWHYDLWGRRLFRLGELTAEGVRNISDAVLWAMSWEACRAEIARIGAMARTKQEEKKQKEHERLLALRLRGTQYEQCEQPGLAADQAQALDG